MLKVFGHISPDTDTTGCAILWAWYLNNHTSQPATPYVLGSLNKETQFILKRWNVEEPALLSALTKEDEVVIVDTNNPEELLPGINDAKIVQIIDHHRLVGGLTTKGPLDITMRTVASTATLIYDLMGKNVETMPESMTGIMLSCILSDTLAFRSPTTTPHDKAIAEKLAAKLKLDIPTYSDEMFAAKSDVSDFTDVGLIHIDSKKIELGDKSLRISVVETTTPASILARKEGIVKAIKEIVKEEGITDILFFVVDILKEEATVFVHNDYTKKLVANSFGVTPDTDTIVLPGVVSRKKQIIPVLKDN